jgi:hypothetical protein
MITRVDEDVLKKLYSDDIIYHYTKSSTAVDYILYNNKLRFSSRMNSIDPIEKEILKHVKIGTGGFAPYSEENEKELTDNDEIATQLHQDLKRKAHSYQQICFCKNKLDRGVFYRFIDQAEEFGFTKPRMWDQYADSYRGVCIAFSKDKLLEKNKHLNYIDSDINYKSYKELKEKNNYVHILKANEKEYRSEIFKKLEGDIFIKHKDYEGENEYRICVTKKVNDEFSDEIFLDVKDCIEAIIISSYANEHQRVTLKKYALENDIPYFLVIWDEKGVSIVNVTYHMGLIKRMQSKVEELYGE